MQFVSVAPTTTKDALSATTLSLNDFEDALVIASNKMSISKSEWLSHGHIVELIRQKMSVNSTVKNKFLSISLSILKKAVQVKYFACR